MSDYLFLVNVGDNIINSINLSKFIPNRRSKSWHEIEYKLGVFTQNTNSLKWNKIDEVEFNKSNNINLKSTDYLLDVGQLAVVIPINIEFIFEKEYFILPEPIRRKIDLSPINDRANICFHKNNAFSSYMGEFPYQMSKIKGSHLSFDPLMKDVNRHIKNKFVFINIHSNKLKNKDSLEFSIANIKTKEKILSQRYVLNSACIINVQPENDVEICFYSKDSLGLPIFISYDDKYLSVEHTHPPSEYFWNNKMKGQQLLKTNWLSQLP